MITRRIEVRSHKIKKYKIFRKGEAKCKQTE